MDVILLERISKLGQMGETVSVKDGYARNFLLPQGKALRANRANRERFESERAVLEARDLERKSEAESVAEKLDGMSFVVVRSAGETGQLYGSVSARDIIEIVGEEGFKIGRNQIDLNTPIKTIGLNPVSIILHADVTVTIEMNVARSADEAARQSKGEDLTSADAIYGTDDDDAIDAEEFFEEGVEADLEDDAVDADAEVADADASEDAGEESGDDDENA